MLDEFGGGGGTIQGLDSAAERYAKLRLAQAVRRGVIARMPQLGPGGYAAQWRKVSQNVTEPALRAGYRDPGAWLRGTLSPGAIGPGPGPAGPAGAAGPSPYQPTYGSGGFDQDAMLSQALTGGGLEQLMPDALARSQGPVGPGPPLTPQMLDPQLLDLLRRLLGAQAPAHGLAQ